MQAAYDMWSANYRHIIDGFLGDVSLPLSMEALDYAVGGILRHVGCRKCGVRVGWMPD